MGCAHREQGRALSIPYGRIPNFAGAKQAAERLMAHPIFKNVKCIKVNPDSPQRYVREEALKRGIMVIVPTPRLKGGFKKFDPAKIPPDKYAEAANLSTSERWAEEVPLKALPGIDLIVTGSVAVTRDGRRCGKGHGYGDLEYAIYRELGHPPVAVVTTVHLLQVVSEFPTDPHDLPVSLIATPEEVIEVANPPPSPKGVDWGTASGTGAGGDAGSYVLARTQNTRATTSTLNSRSGKLSEERWS